MFCLVEKHSDRTCLFPPISELEQPKHFLIIFNSTWTDSAKIHHYFSTAELAYLGQRSTSDKLIGLNTPPPKKKKKKIELHKALFQLWSDLRKQGIISRAFACSDPCGKKKLSYCCCCCRCCCCLHVLSCFVPFKSNLLISYVPWIFCCCCLLVGFVFVSCSITNIKFITIGLHRTLFH